MRYACLGLRFLAVLLGGCLATISPVSAQPANPLVDDPTGGVYVPGGATQQEPLVTVSAQFTQPAPRRPARLFITAKLKPGWYIYSITQAPGGPKPTVIELTPSPAYRRSGEFQASPPAQKKREPIFNNLVIETHTGEVTWFAPIELAPGFDPGAVSIEGVVRTQVCDPGSCLQRTFRFAAKLGAGIELSSQQSQPAPPPKAAKPAVSHFGGELPWHPYTTFDEFKRIVGPSFDPEKLKRNVAEGFDQSNLYWQILLAFFGGIVLNLMPCVLPVIGLKILSFVEQAGENRRRALMLNIWYSAGLLSIFLLLASLAVFLNLGWGHLFKYAGFNIVLAAVVFAMGLSFLGVWEIPIPGFVGSGKAAGLAEKEGFSGAFAKGVITTILATPCTGPFMGTALAWAVSQPPLNVYAVFTSVGLGMASPYLLVGAFPKLIRFLPRPGAWMETFKQVMGFVLLGTVVYIFTFLHWPYVVPTIGLLFSLWVACWWIGRTPPTVDLNAKLRAWLEAGTFVAAMWLVMFPGIDEIVSGRFAFRGLQEVMADRFEDRYQRKGAGAGRLPDGPNTVLIDFTADWCLTCKTLEAQVLNTAEVRRLVDRNRVITLQADWTQEAPEVDRLKRLFGGGVPIVAVLPAGDPNKPTGVFRGGCTPGQVLDALKRAGPSP